MPFSLARRLSYLFRAGRQYDAFPLPVLPLHSVLFPGGKLALKVVEARHIASIQDCAAAGNAFGICLARDNAAPGALPEPVPVGCVVEIKTLATQADGTLNVTVRGRRRFRIERLDTVEGRLPVAHATPISPEPPLALPERHLGCATTLRRMIERLGEERCYPPLVFDDAVWVGYRLAELLPLKLSVRQDMLEMNDTLVRLEILHRFLAQQGLIG